MSALRVDELEGRRKRLHLIGNAHLDIAWLWPCWEGFAAVKATFRSALDRMTEHEQFQFSASSAAYYEWIQENDPAIFEEIRGRVAEGRWHLVGGWWVEPDCNLPGGEALVRQALLGQTYFREQFGRTATVGYNVDSFGHPASLPQLLLKSGLTAYVFMRPQPHERKLPARTFAWESVDGSRVTAFRVPFEYGTSGETLPAHIERCAVELQESGGASMCFFGVGNHGGGPTRANIETIDRLAKESKHELVFSSPADYFAEIAEDASMLPVVRDELQHHASGCYAAHSAVKQWNRQAENRLLVAEKLSTIARRLTGINAGLSLRAAWKNVLLNQFHDILAGTSLESAYEDAREAYGEAKHSAAKATHQALQAIAWQIDIPFADGSTPIVVFNPHAWPSRANLELETDGLSDANSLVDETSACIPLQTMHSTATVGSWRRRVSFTADLPPLGYRVFRTSMTASPTAPTPSGPNVIETDRWRLTVDPRTANVSSLVDRRHGCEVIGAPGGRAVVMADPSDTWGHNVTRFQQEIATFAPVRIELREHGPVKSVLRVQSRYHDSTLTQDFSLIKGLDAIVVDVSVDWHERHQLLKLRWPVRVRMPKATYEIPYGTVERSPSGDEEPGQSWFDVTGIHERTGESYGLSMLNDAKYSFDVRGAEMSLTVLRSPAFAHHEPFTPESWEGIAFLDQGVQRFRYALLPHAGDWRDGQTARRAAELNQPAMAMLDTFHGGPLPLSKPFLEATPAAIAVTAIKLAEDGSGDVIVRAFESSGEPVRGRICLYFLDQAIDADFRPHELKTFRVGTGVHEVNLIECSS
ncbi:MAG TPA: glycoside hydrolase family 38 C-terminal domain-containing protein [Candidatus Dormibacteraeota bacterium]|nr:glycoside hydrolase family 38 C-terminal domain-containing protein [Candidatus Dormibacteraeota bacterium]